MPPARVAPAAEPARDWRRVAFAMFGVGYGANHFASMLLVYRDRLGLSPTELYGLFGAYALGLVPGLLLGGPASDRLGRRRIFLPGCLVSLAGSVVLLLAPSFPLALLLGRLTVGAATGMVASSGSAWLGDLADPTRKGLAARRATVALSSGFGAGPLCSGLLAQWAPAPMVLPYLLHALLLGPALLWLGGVSDPLPQAPARGPLLRLALPAAARRPFWRELLPMAPWVFAFPSIAAVVLPGLLREQVPRWAIAYGGLVAATALGSGIVAQPLTRALPGLSAAVGGLGVGTLGLGLGALAVAAGRPALAFPSAILLGAGYGLGMTSGLRRVSEVSPPEQLGALTGIFFALTYLGFAAPVLMALASRVLPPVSVLWACAGLAATTALWLLATVRPLFSPSPRASP